MSQSNPEYPLSIGEIVKLTGEPLHRSESLIRTCAVQPVRGGGNVHLYDEPGVERIQRSPAASRAGPIRQLRQLPEHLGSSSNRT